MSKQILPIGTDNFREIREQNKYYIDKSLMIRDFVAFSDKVALVTRPRRFGKTLNMTMLREFFDITKDSRDIFSGLQIMETEYAGLMNTKPVIYFTFKDCNANDPKELAVKLCRSMVYEFKKYADIRTQQHVEITKEKVFTSLLQKMIEEEADLLELSGAIALLENVVYEIYHQPVILLLDEYDTPIMSSHQCGYHEQISGFIADFYGSALKGQDYLCQALLTGIQRVAKESVFSKLNNVIVYSSFSKEYAQYFGLTETETARILQDYELELNDDVRKMYDGYRIGGCEIYNPWSVINYCKTKELKPYWIHTSSNILIRECLNSFNLRNREDFDELITNGAVEVDINLETSYSELESMETLWGLFVNAGYVTIIDTKRPPMALLKIPNQEVKEEFQRIITEQIGIKGSNFYKMVYALADADYTEFEKYYKRIILSCTSYYDSIRNAGQYENPYHMLTLGMVISLDYLYDVKSNYEAGDGRADIRMISKEPDKRAHIIIEFKQADDIENASKRALEQIFEKRYAEDLLLDIQEGKTGQVLCIGIAHNKKDCRMEARLLP